MRRFAILAALACGATALLVPGGALGAGPVGSCPPAASGFVQVDRAGWWERTVAGFEAEGIPVYDEHGNYSAEFEAFARSWGFEDAAAFEHFILWGAQWARYDRNDDGYVCMKAGPRTPGFPAYLFVAMDNTAAAQ
jgi:hypothetical protein